MCGGVHVCVTSVHLTRGVTSTNYVVQCSVGILSGESAFSYVHCLGHFVPAKMCMNRISTTFRKAAGAHHVMPVRGVCVYVCVCVVCVCGVCVCVWCVMLYVQAHLYMHCVHTPQVHIRVYITCTRGCMSHPMHVSAECLKINLMPLHACADSYKWSSPETSGESPPPLAAHGCAVVGNMLYIFGGLSTEGVATDQLYALNTGMCSAALLGVGSAT